MVNFPYRLFIFCCKSTAKIRTMQYKVSFYGNNSLFCKVQFTKSRKHAYKKEDCSEEQSSLFCAQDETRTHTVLRPLPPQSSVYTNFTTCASLECAFLPNIAMSLFGSAPPSIRPSRPASLSSDVVAFVRYV